MTQTSEPHTLDLAAVKQRQQQTWASGDFSMVGARIVLVAEQLVDTADLHAGWRVLDVATGSGNAAIAAARLGCIAVGLDYVPSLLDRARRRASAECLHAEFVEGDAESLPFPDASFDAVTSVFGAMFAPDQERTASEIARVTRSGGRIGLIAHTPEGFIGQLFKTNAKHVPPVPGLKSPILWGTEARLRELFGATIADLQVRKRHWVFRYRSPEAYLDYWRHWYGPTLKTFEAVGPDGEAALRQDLLDLVARFNVAVDGTMAVPSEYLEAVITRR